MDTDYTNVPFVIDTMSYNGVGEVLKVDAAYEVLNALRSLTSPNTNVYGGNRTLALDKALASNVSQLAFMIGGRLYGRFEQRTLTYTPTGGTTTVAEAISLRTSSDGTVLTDAIVADPATGGVDALADSVSMVSAALTDLSSARKKKVVITGTTAITSFGPGKHLERLITFQSDGLVLTYNETSLKLQTGANITTRAGDTCHATSDASGNWHVRDYTRADGTPLRARDLFSEDAPNHAFYLRPRADVDLLFPVPVLRPQKVNTVLAFDLMPNGAPTEAAPHGYTWFDLCDKDMIVNPSVAVSCARVGITSTGAQFGSVLFNGGPVKDIEFLRGGTIVGRWNASGLAIGTTTGQAAGCFDAISASGTTHNICHVIEGAGVFGTTTNHPVQFYANGTLHWNLQANGALVPATDNAKAIGTSALRASAVYSAGGVITTSDERQKDRLEDPVPGLDFVTDLASAAMLFRWKVGGNDVEIVDDEEEAKDDAEGEPFGKRTIVTPRPGKRIHAGFGAQSVKAVMEKHGVDFGAYVYDPETDVAGLRDAQLIPSLYVALAELSELVAQQGRELADLKSSRPTDTAKR